jgi:hypothetical protein
MDEGCRKGAQRRAPGTKPRDFAPHSSADTGVVKLSWRGYGRRHFSVHLDVWTDPFDDFHKPQALTSARKHQHFRPKIALDVGDLKGIPRTRHREFPDAGRVNFATFTINKGKCTEPASRQRNHLSVDRDAPVLSSKEPPSRAVPPPSPPFLGISEPDEKRSAAESRHDHFDADQLPVPESFGSWQPSRLRRPGLRWRLARLGRRSRRTDKRQNVGPIRRHRNIL